jgi:hypothetical protein
VDLSIDRDHVITSDPIKNPLFGGAKEKLLRFTSRRFAPLRFSRLSSAPVRHRFDYCLAHFYRFDGRQVVCSDLLTRRLSVMRLRRDLGLHQLGSPRSRSSLPVARLRFRGGCLLISSSSYQ